MKDEFEALQLSPSSPCRKCGNRRHCRTFATCNAWRNHMIQSWDGYRRYLAQAKSRQLWQYESPGGKPASAAKLR